MPLLCLLSHQRSGSHYLKQTLDSYNKHLDDIQSDGQRYLALPEVFTKGIGSNSPYWINWLFDPFHTERLLEDPIKWGNPQGIAEAANLFLEHLHEQSKEQIVLADIKLNQLYIGEGWYHQASAPPRMIYKLAAKSKIIFLRRRNLIRAVFSGLQAKQTGVWHVQGESGTKPVPVKITVDVDRFIAQMSNLDRGLAEAEAWLSNYPNTVHSIYYEDLFNPRSLACNNEAFDQIAYFAGMCEGIDWQSPLKKIGTYPLEDVIENFNELRKRLLPTKFASMLADDSFLRIVRYDAA